MFALSPVTDIGQEASAEIRAEAPAVPLTWYRQHADRMLTMPAESNRELRVPARMHSRVRARVGQSHMSVSRRRAASSALLLARVAIFHYQQIRN